jgi:cobaltochelatase CobS
MAMTSPLDASPDPLVILEPHRKVTLKEAFGIDSDMVVPAFETRDSHVPEIDESYRFDPQTTLAICAGFAYDRRVMVQGYHGTGKSTHIEQVAARLNWPMVRVNLDAHVSRIDLIGKDAIVLKEGKQITEFREGILPWSLQRPVALVFDEYDAGRPDVMFVIQRVLEAQGRLTLLDQNRVIRPNKWFRLFATSNTVGLGDTTGLYHGAQQINQAQLDRWNIVTDAQLSRPRRRGRDRRRQGAGVERRRGQAPHRRHGPRRRHDPQRFHERRHLDRHVAPHGHHLGPERHHLWRRRGPELPPDLPEQVRRTGTADHR